MNIAKCLISHGADVNKLDNNGLSFLWKAIQNGINFFLNFLFKGDISICEFLTENDADVNFVNKKTGDTLLHVLAQNTIVQLPIYDWANQNIKNFNVNATNLNGR